METDDLSWLSAELGLPVFEETARGLFVSAAAQPHADVPQLRASVEAAVAAHTRLPVHEPSLVQAVQQARQGQRARVTLGPNAAGTSWLLLATPASQPGLVRLTLAPASSPTLGAHGDARHASPLGGATAQPSTPGHPREDLVEVAAAVSHEVANAVGTIRGWAELALHADPLGDVATVDTRDALTLIRAAARSAEQAARSMLALARGEAEAHEGQPLDLSTFAGELLQLLTLTAREARVTLESSIEPGLHVHASRAQLFTMLFNLLKNAVEACGPGGLVKVQATGDRDSVRVSVRDTGSGLDSQAKKRIFERYYTTKSTGTGLGLALVHSTAEASGARIEVDSEPGRGTVFRVILPRASEPAFAPTPVPESAWTSAHPSEAPGQPLELRVLVVDDDQALREMIATALSLRGADVISVRSSEEALELHGSFDIALIDMMLDDCRGDELLATLRQRGVVNAAMLVTGTVQKPRLVPGGEPDDWVRKPFEISHLVDRIRRTLERHRMLVDAGQIARA